MTFRILEDRNMPTATPTPTWQASQPAHVARDVPPVLPHTGFVRESRLLLFLPFSHSTLWRRVSAKTFPAPVRISGRITAWRVEDIRAWIEQQGHGGAAAG
ncbi:helix-turn-helix transcriptional regulator [Verminephrobacter eiseniae]|uniref:helix-turn-helix transcriptional regulator n=1 Tax=Verminephrobacter eiseniae TaxID=364317 RepID=UPI002A64F8E8|nr:AlpA family phage regulatory protein [Verminephrobacter eiseniae]MCW5230904.1 AlpA family phage regulatory protein [Verminephrobacter eiseniae]MCW5292637.1 AlpA family phage regulatory protein [Verminephrobacter eiseniae]MCW8187954.1 AlpA family phage regulatory protein [Verminephrobacter eiseniae]MCW8226232.1 AlpA family phage regulatory protein [Verminephrobacter eiseniae]MCW8237096.1 AlpA family phage regulatory protein [Verminephrobacter eiseniae]